MNSKAMLEALDAAGEALKATGEQSIVFGFFAGDGTLRSHDVYTVRLDLPGTTGVHGSGPTPRAAFVRALEQRAEDERRAQREARIRALVEAEEAAEQTKRAA